ncbi:MAG: biotin--[acetyl-CoA-carboxylase] ligase [Planctomycetes bacterium]|nr:biotin--[acetyl-CoA-carboxylase] ligase [Planctomycetota bacterium]
MHVIVMGDALLDIDRISLERAGGRIGRRVEYVESLDSTNAEAWRRIEHADADGLVVFAEHQTAGRGRLGRTWEAPRGAGLLMSVVVFDQPVGQDCVANDSATGARLGVAIAVATCDAIARTAGVTVVIKWPNDLLIGGRKVAGILIESRKLSDARVAYVIGIGINCLQHRGHLIGPLAKTATSLEIESEFAIDRTALAVEVLRHLEEWVLPVPAVNVDRLRAAWMQRCEPMGRRVHLLHGGKAYAGSMIDIDPGAGLVVQLDEGGVRAFSALETTVLPSPTTVDE